MRLLLSLVFFVLSTPLSAQQVIPLEKTYGLHSAYVIPLAERNNIDVQVIVLSGSNDDGGLSGIAHYTEHLVALWGDKKVLQKPRQRDLNAFTFAVSTVYTNSGTREKLDQVMQLSRAVLDTPALSQAFMETEIDIVKRETYYRERIAPVRWLQRRVQQKLYGAKDGRANDAVADLDRLSVRAALQFHHDHYQASNVMIVFSGDIDQATAQDALNRYFSDTVKTTQVPDLWLDHHPQDNLRVIERITTPRVQDDIIAYAKFFEFQEPQDILAMQASFFIASSIYNSFLDDRLYYDSFIAQNFSHSSYIAIDGDLEFNAYLVPADGVSLDDALNALEDAIKALRDDGISAEDIKIARAKNVAFTQSLALDKNAQLDFFQNLGSDGLPPTSPTQFAKLVANASDEEILKILSAFAADSPSAALLVTAQGTK